jgi:hypothetical protein
MFLDTVEICVRRANVSKRDISYVALKGFNYISLNFSTRHVDAHNSATGQAYDGH